jgi:outer membrane lipoprotein carrier protein
MRFQVAVLAYAVMLAAAAPAAEAPPSAKAPPQVRGDARALARKVQAYYESIRDLRASFVQTYTYLGIGRRQESRGTLLVKRPGRMRWDYASPTPKSIAVVGSRLTQYEPEANQVFVDERFDSTAMSAAVTFLVGRGNLEQEFAVALGDDGSLVLTPRQADPRVQTVTLLVGPDGEVLRTRVVDGQGNTNDLAFDKLTRNAGLRDADFDIKVPADAHRVGVPGR